MSSTSIGASHAGVSPGTSFTVQLSPDFVNRVSELIRRIGPSEIESGTEILGPLFGIVDNGSVIVRSLRMVPVHDMRMDRRTYFGGAFDRLLAVSQADLRSLELIGWCCIHSSSWKGLLESDAAFHNERFQETTDIALILRPEGETLVSVELFARSENGDLASDNCYWGARTFQTGDAVTAPVEISMQAKAKPRPDRALPSKVLAGSERTESSRTQQTSSSSEPQTHSESLALTAPSTSALSKFSSFRVNGLLWVSAILVLAGAATAMFLGLLLYTNSSRPRTNATKASAAPAVTPVAGMKVEAQQGDRLLVTWNHDSPVIKTAKYGILIIQDGLQHREINFAPGEMTTGSILYRPASDDVTFRLDVLGHDNSLITESVHVLDGSMQASSNGRPLTPDGNLQANPLRSNQGVLQHNPAATNPALSSSLTTDQRAPDLAGGLTEDKSSPSAPFQTQLPTPANRELAITPPPKLAITTSPASAGTELHSLPSPPPLSREANLSTGRTAPAKSASDVLGAPKLSTTAPAHSAASVTNSASIYKPPRPLKQVIPDTKALQPWEVSGIDQVEVQVKVDEAGHVTSARLIQNGKKTGALGRSALDAARGWIFEPAMLRGKAVASDHTIVFQFRPQAKY